MKFKQILSFVLVLVMTFMMLPQAQAASDYFPRYSGGDSIVDALKAIGADSSYAYRERIAQANQISGYEGTPSQNRELLSLLAEGTLRRPEAGQDFTCKSYSECTTNGVCYEVTRNDCAVRSRPESSSKLLGTLALGSAIRVTDISKNRFGNRWARLAYTDSDGNAQEAYVYAKNIQQHVDHAFLTVMNTGHGTVKVCTVCGYAEAESYEDGTSESCDLYCVVDQAVRGDYADQLSFWGLVARIGVGELPYVGTAADLRDLVYDCTHDPDPLIIGLDVAAVLPLIGTLRYLSKMDDVKLVAKGAKTASGTLGDIPWGTWADYAKVTQNGKEYAKIGDFLYTEHAVTEFLPPETYGKVHYINGQKTEARAISPTYIQYAMTDGLAEGTTIRVAKDSPYYEDLVKTGLIQKSEKYTVYSTGNIDILYDEPKNVIVSVIDTRTNSGGFETILKMMQPKP